MLVTMREEESPAPHELHMRRKLCSRCTDKLIVELVHGHCLDSALITDGPESCHGLPAPDLIAHFVSLLPALFLHSPSVCSVFSSMYRRVHILVNTSIGKDKDCETGGHRSSMAIPVPTSLQLLAAPVPILKTKLTACMQCYLHLCLQRGAISSHN